MDLVYGKNAEVNFQEGLQLTETTNDEYRKVYYFK